MSEQGSDGFSKDYWDLNYSEPDDMDGIGNAEVHVAYMKNLFAIEYIDISSVIDFGFGLGHLFERTLKEFIPYKAYGIEPSKHAFDIVNDRDIRPVASTKLKLQQIDLKSWCEREKNTKKRFDLGLCTSVFQYLSDEEIEFCLEVMSHKVKYLYFSVPTNVELNRQVEELEFEDTFAIKRSRSKYQKMIKKHFTFVSSRLLESKVYFDDRNTSFTDLLFRF